MMVGWTDCSLLVEGWVDIDGYIPSGFADVVLVFGFGVMRGTGEGLDTWCICIHRRFVLSFLCIGRSFTDHCISAPWSGHYISIFFS